MSEMTEPLAQILVVDDEQVQLDTVCRGLLFYGYRCQSVLSVEAAIAVLADHGGTSVDLVLTDLTMPGRSGIDLIERVRKDWPELPIVVFTGLATTADVEIVRKMNIPLLPKPFDPDTLDTTIRRALGL